jgi:putative transposase
VVTPAARREAAYLRRVFEISERRACRVIGSDRTSVRYRGVRPNDGALRERLYAANQLVKLVMVFVKKNARLYGSNAL